MRIGISLLGLSNGGNSANARRNLLSWSQDFSNGVWVGSNRTITTGQTDPLGGTTAATVTATAANGIIYQAVTSPLTQAITSIYVKRVAGTGPIYLRTTTGTATNQIDISGSLTSEWQRFSSNVAGGTAGALYSGYLFIATSGDAIDVAFAQTEAGSTVTAYQATNGTGVI